MDVIDYYNENVTKYSGKNVKVDMIPIYAKFFKFVKPKGKILDLGCGSGRDSKYFIKKGFDVCAIDGSAEMCRVAREYTGLDVKNMLFEDMDFVDEFDGIWASNSLLHIPYDELSGILGKIARAMKFGAVLYMGFKYGGVDGDCRGRHFTNMTEERMEELLETVSPLRKIEIFTSRSEKHPDEDRLRALVLKGVK